MPQRLLRIGTDLGSQIICSTPGVRRICAFVCKWDNYLDIFPTVCLGEDTEHGSDSLDKVFCEAYRNFSRSLGLNGKMYAAQKELKMHRNAMVLYRGEMKAIYRTEEIEKVNFDLLETSLQTILDLMRNVPEDLFVFLNHVGIIPNTVLFQIAATKIAIEGILKNKSMTYHSSNGVKRKTTPEGILRNRFLEHAGEWKVMVDRLIKLGKSIKIRFNKLEDECLSLMGSIKTAITQMKDQKADKMSAWSLLKRLGVHFEWINP